MLVVAVQEYSVLIRRPVAVVGHVFVRSDAAKRGVRSLQENKEQGREGLNRSRRREGAALQTVSSVDDGNARRRDRPAKIRRGGGPCCLC